MTVLMTITGADERTPIDELARLTEQHSWLEIGLLYTATPEGRNRYPGWEWLVDASKTLTGRCALHVCGRGARKSLLAGELTAITRHAARLQINGLLSPPEVRMFCAVHRYRTVITQDESENEELRLASTLPNHALLVDGSGGRGISPAEWTRPTTWKPVGFAGGLGPDNFAAELPKIAAVATGDWWVDMENRLRTDDWFDLEKANRAIEVFAAFLEHYHG